MMLKKTDLLSTKSGLLKSCKHVSYLNEFLKVELTQKFKSPITSQITPACMRLNQTQIGLSNLCMIGCPCSVFDPELEHYKFVEKSQYKNKNPVSTRGSMYQICIISKA